MAGFIIGLFTGRRRSKLLDEGETGSATVSYAADRNVNSATWAASSVQMVVKPDDGSEPFEWSGSLDVHSESWLGISGRNPTDQFEIKHVRFSPDRGRVAIDWDKMRSEHA
jgi:hypothetical protein